MRVFWLVFIPAFAYQVLAVLSAVRHRTKRAHPPEPIQPGVSVLKPVRGLDPNTSEAFLSQVLQDYPSFEVLFGVHNEADPAVPEIRRLQERFPGIAIHLVISTTAASNGKVGVLIDLARHAKHPIWVVNDSDILVTPAYLSAVVAPLASPNVGVVTCLYRASAHSQATIWEALGIATDFMPSALVAQQLGVREFGFGSTLAFRASDLATAGSFEAFADYLADDYQLAKRITSLGKRALLSSFIVETSLGEGTWAGVWNHQLRWARTIRACKGKGYLGLPITHAGLWAALALATGAWIPALALTVARITSAFTTAHFVLEARQVSLLAWLAPLWDLYAFGVWLASYARNRVRWRNKVLTINRQGKILS